MKCCIFTGYCEEKARAKCCHFCKKKRCSSRCKDDPNECKYYLEEDQEDEEETGGGHEEAESPTDYDLEWWAR